MFFAWSLLKKLRSIDNAQAKDNWEKDKEFEEIEFGSGLRYGKMAIISAVGVQGITNEDISSQKLTESVSSKLLFVLQRWAVFEDYAKTRKENKDYMIDKGFDLDNYYKGRTINSDIRDFFKPTDPS